MKSRIRWVENALFIAESDSGHSIVIDGPPDGGGRNMGVRPMEMLLMGMGGCTAYDVMHILKRARQPVTGCEAILDATRAETVPAVFTHIHVHFIVSGGDDLKQSQVEKAIKLSAEKYCSASIMLSQAVEITHDYEIIRDSSGAPREQA